ncbi:ATP-binding protein [Sporomusa carbonis]|uniref:ATP-binding protein n=1 Tax=Sporomusa carbonis TaxID=3076075 RepID=UPI003C7BBD18
MGGSGQSAAIRIEVIDTGIGIAADDLEHIFDYFYRVDQARTKQSGGTGLDWLYQANGAGARWPSIRNQHAGARQYFYFDAAAACP